MCPAILHETTELRKRAVPVHLQFVLLTRKSFGGRTLRLARNEYVYASDKKDTSVYFIERGRIKLLIPSPEGKECLLAIRAAGDIFGELSLSGQYERMETAVAMQETTLKQIPARSLMASLGREGQIESLVQYLAVRIAEQQEAIVTLTTVNSEHRLARTLLNLARTIGRSDPGGMHIGSRLSHAELAKMVGTTRTRIGIFLKKLFQLGLMGQTGERCFVIDERRSRQYLDDCLFCPRQRECRDLTEASLPEAGNLESIAGQN